MGIRPKGVSGEESTGLPLPDQFCPQPDEQPDGYEDEDEGGNRQLLERSRNREQERVKQKQYPSHGTEADQATDVPLGGVDLRGLDHSLRRLVVVRYRPVSVVHPFVPPQLYYTNNHYKGGVGDDTTADR